MERVRLHRRSARIPGLRQALDDDQLLGNVLKGDSWLSWRTLLIAANGEALTDKEREIFQQLTGREREPLQRIQEFIGVIGRRGGKSRAISALATYEAALVPHPMLVPGERGIVLVIAPDQKQARICLDYIEANFRQSPMLRQLIEARTARALRLSNRIDVEVRASDFRTLRGSTFAACIRYYGKADDPLILVAQAPSRTMNPSLPQSVVDRAMERDPASAAAEFGAQFRADIESFVSIEAVKACVASGILERQPIPGTSYYGFVDPAGGSGSDSMTLCIGHIDHAKQTVVVDAIRERRPPFSPENVTQEFASVLKAYNVFKIIGDKNAGGFPPEQFGKFNILYDQAAAPKSELYQDLLATINSVRIELLDHPRLIAQLMSLERRNVRSSRPVIDHPPGAHDDVANCVAGLASINTQYPAYDLNYMGWQDDKNADREAQAARYQRQRLAGYIYHLSGGQIFPG